MVEQASPAAATPALAEDDAPTLIAIAALAFVLADVAHEVIGHGAAFLAVGGRAAVMTTTRLIVDTKALGDPGGRIFSIGGPLGNLALAGLACWVQRLWRGLGAHARTFLWLSMAFNLLWAVGYLIYSGVLGIGDWAELVRGLAPSWLWRTLLLGLGTVLYLFSARALAREMRWFADANDRDWPRRAWRMVLLAYVAAGIVACAGAWPDPRGASQVLDSAIPETLLGNLALLRVPRLFTGSPHPPGAAPARITRSRGWIAAASLAVVAYVGLLGPGIPISI